MTKPEPAKGIQSTTKISYLCEYGATLFDEEDIAHESELAGTKYFFVRTRNTQARVDRHNRAMCENCDVRVGRQAAEDTFQRTSDQNIILSKLKQ